MNCCDNTRRWTDLTYKSHSLFLFIAPMNPDDSFGRSISLCTVHLEPPYALNPVGQVALRN